MDVLAVAMAKKYTDSQRLGYEETKELVWDGDTTGKVILEEIYVRVSEEPIDLTKIVSFILSGIQIDASNSECNVVSMDEYTTTLSLGEAPMIVSITEDHYVEDVGSTYYKGTYFLQGVTAVEMHELKTIDPKYLPVGGGLPFVEITSAAYPIAERKASEDTVAVPVSAVESEKLTNAASQGLPVIIKFTGDMGEEGQVPLCYVFNNMSAFFLETRSPYNELNLSFACHDGVNWYMGA